MTTHHTQPIQSLARVAAVWAACALTSAGALAGVIVQPTSVSTNYAVIGGSFDRTIDQSGLSQNYVSGVTDFASFAATTHAGVGPGNGVQISFPNQGGTSATYGLGGLTSIAGLAYWGHQFGGHTQVVSFFADLDNDISNGTLGLLGSITDLSGSGSDTLAFTAVTASFVHMVLASTSQGTPVFAELAFDQQVPEPATMLLAGLGLAAACGTRTRRKWGQARR